MPGNREGIDKIGGIGAVAVAQGKNWISFSVEDTKVMLATFSAQVSLISVAEEYAVWLAEN